MFGSKSELKIGKLEDLAGIEANPRTGAWKNGAYVCGAMEGSWSKNSLPVKPGDTVEFEATVKLVAPAKNGKTGPFLAGAIFLDKSGKMISYPQRQDQPTAAGRTMTGMAKAPAEAASVRLALGGSWEPGEPAADYVMSFEKASLWKV